MERQGEAYELGEQLTVIGRKLSLGDRAPNFELESFDSQAGAMKTVRLSDSAGKIRLLNVVNSLDTPVCHIETHKWEQLNDKLPNNTVVYTISMDLPFAQARWKDSEGVKRQQMLSAHKSENFGQDYGALIKEWRLLQRVVLVIDQNDRVVHAEYVPDQMAEPDYNAAIEASTKANK